MKTRFYFPVLGLTLLLAACQKEEQLQEQKTFAPPPSDRCGCMAPVEFQARNATNVSIDLNWNAMPEAIAYRLEVADHFNATDATGAIIFLETLEGTRTTVTHLAPNTRYEYRITSLCGNSESSPSDIQSFVTGDFGPGGDPDPKPRKASGGKQVALQ